MELSFLDGDSIPSHLSADQVRSYFPLGLRGLKESSSNEFVFPNQDGTVSLKPGVHYTQQQQMMMMMMQQQQQQNQNQNNNNNTSYFPPISPARPYLQQQQTNNNNIQLGSAQRNYFGRGSKSNQNSNLQQPGSPHRVLEDSDEEIGQIIPSPQVLSQNQNHNNNDSKSDNHHEDGEGVLPKNLLLLADQPIPFVASQLVVRRGKLIMDRVHDHIMLPPLVCRIVDSPEFQRLRYLKQLGSTTYLYPGATHTRFEHSVGVCHLAGLMAKKIARRQPELQVTDLDVLCVMVAGLCHDLGHGPFSHLFEVVVNESLKRSAGGSVLDKNKSALNPNRRHWHHEEMSTTLVRRIFHRLREENDETVMWISDEDINFIVLAIDGLRPGKPWPEEQVGREDSKRFLLDIVANKRNGIDVDKLDYFMRDSLACYGKAAIDIHISRLINSCRAIRHEGEMQICFEEKMAMSLGDIFSVRAKLHKYAYQHRTSKVVDHMIKDALMLAEPYFLVRGSGGQMRTFVDAVDDPDAFILLGDWILNAIAADGRPELAPAREVIERLHTRKLYVLVGGAQLRMDRLSNEDIKMQIVDLFDDTSFAASADARAKLEKALVVDVVKITYGSSDDKGNADDPINHVTFFNPKGDIDQAFRLPSDRRNPLFSPMAYSERSLLVLSRDKEMQAAASEAFEMWKKASNRFLENAIPVYNSPAPNRRQREETLKQFNNNNNNHGGNNNLFASGGGFPRGSTTANGSTMSNNTSTNNNNFSASRNPTQNQRQPQQQQSQNQVVHFAPLSNMMNENAKTASAISNKNEVILDNKHDEDEVESEQNSLDGPPKPPLSQQ